MLFFLPSLLLTAIYVLAAVLPAAFLLRYIYKKDTVEREPPMLLLSLLLMGIAAAFAAIALEWLGEGVLSLFFDSGSPAYSIISAFLIVAAAEEGAKFFFLRLRTWRSPAFNYRFDGVVYAVFVSLGFAAFENISYVFGYGLSVAFSRALLAIPAHMGFAVFMGSYYGRAKVCDAYGDTAGSKRNLFAGYLISVLLHGFYDACLMLGTGLSTIAFLAFVVIMYIVVIKRINRETDSDLPI